MRALEVFVTIHFRLADAKDLLAIRALDSITLCCWLIVRALPGIMGNLASVFLAAG